MVGTRAILLVALAQLMQLILAIPVDAKMTR